MKSNNKQKNNILDLFSINFGPVGLDLSKLRNFFKKETNRNVALLVAKRFERIFNEHGVATSQIPRLIPQITLGHLNNLPDSLVPALTSEVIDKTVKLFQIRRSWLEGLGNRIYDCNWYYKRPKHFFEDIAVLDLDCHNVSQPIIAFCQTDTISRLSFRKQPVVLVFAEKIFDLNDNEINRYRISDNWNWNYLKCRVQLKAMIRVLHKVKGTVIPLYKVSSDVLVKIENGFLVPNVELLNTLSLHDISLEDFSLYPEESYVYKEPEELPMIENYIKNYDLENIALKFLNKK